MRGLQVVLGLGIKVFRWGSCAVKGDEGIGLNVRLGMPLDSNEKRMHHKGRIDKKAPQDLLLRGFF